MKNILLLKTHVVPLVVAAFFSFLLAFGFGYFLGRYEQSLVNKGSLQTIPELNCALES